MAQIWIRHIPRCMCDKTQSHVRHDSCTYVTCKTCDMTRSYVWHDPFVPGCMPTMSTHERSMLDSCSSCCASVHVVTWLIHMLLYDSCIYYDLTHSYVVKALVHMCVMSHSYRIGSAHAQYNRQQHVIFVRLCMRDMTHSHVATCRMQMRDTPMPMCDMTQAHRLHTYTVHKKYTTYSTTASDLFLMGTVALYRVCSTGLR